MEPKRRRGRGKDASGQRYGRVSACNPEPSRHVLSQLRLAIKGRAFHQTLFARAHVSKKSDDDSHAERERRSSAACSLL